MRRKEFGPLSPAHLGVLQPNWEKNPFTRCLYTSLAFQRNEEHQRSRALVSKDFTRSKAASHRDLIAQIIGELLDTMDRHVEVDLEEALALPFAALTIGRVLGIPDSVALELGRLARTAGTVYEPMASAQQRTAEVEAGTRMAEGLAEVLAERRRTPQHDLMTHLVRHNGENEEAALNAALLLFGAGFDSPASMVCLGTRLYIEHPEQAQRLRGDPSLAIPAAEEVLRCEPPVQMVVRTAYVPTRLEGVQIPTGGVVFGLLASGNRDPAVAPEPDQFDIGRKPIPTLSFALGAHYCLGAPLSRLQAELLFPKLLNRFPSIQLAGAPVYRAPGSMLRGLDSMPVRLR